MDTSFNKLLESFSAVATRGPLAFPLWAAFVFIVLYFVRKGLFRLVFHAVGGKDSALEKSIEQRIDVPLQLLLLTLALIPFAPLIADPYGIVVKAVTNLMAFTLLFYIIIQALDLAIFSWYLQHKGTQVASVVRFFTLAILYVIALLLLLDWGLGVSILPLLATSTVLTAIFGLALQDTLKNVFAGLNMSLERSFDQGDWVAFRLDGNEVLFGQIVEIGWRTTKIRTMNNNHAVIPNSKFTSQELINFNKPSTAHALTVEVPISIKADPDKVRKALREAAISVSGVLSEPQPEAMVLKLNQSEATFQVRFWIDNVAERERLISDVLEKSWAALSKGGSL